MEAKGTLGGEDFDSRSTIWTALSVLANGPLDYSRLVDICLRCFRIYSRRRVFCRVHRIIATDRSIGTFLPDIIAIKNGSLHLSLEFTYRSYFAIYAPGIVAVALAATMTKFPQIGRRLTMIVSSALMGISIILFSLANSEASNIGLNTMEYFFQSMFNAVLYGWTPEVFPTSVRGTASGLASFWGRLFSIITPIIANSILGKDGLRDETSVRKILYFAGGITLGCVATITLMPHKALGKNMGK